MEWTIRILAVSKLSTISLFILMTTIAYCSSLSLTSCGSGSSVRVNKVDLRPSRLQAGQPATIYAEWEVVGDIIQPIKAETKIFRDVFAGIRIAIPCSQGGTNAEFGSCTYNNVCQLLKGNFCDFTKGSRQADLNFKVPSGRMLMGNYDLELRLSDGMGREVGCWKVTVGVH